LGAGRKKFERRSVPLFSNLLWRAPGKQNDAVPQGAMGVFPGAVTEHETGLHWGDTRLNAGLLAAPAGCHRPAMQLHLNRHGVLKGIGCRIEWQAALYRCCIAQETSPK
jgi:hypothetical protein